MQYGFKDKYHLINWMGSHTGQRLSMSDDNARLERKTVYTLPEFRETQPTAMHLSHHKEQYEPCTYFY